MTTTSGSGSGSGSGTTLTLPAAARAAHTARQLLAQLQANPATTRQQLGTAREHHNTIHRRRDVAVVENALHALNQLLEEVTSRT